MLYLNELILILCLQKWFYFCTSKRVIVLEVTGPELCFPFSVKKNSSQFSSLLCIFLGLFEENIYIYIYIFVTKYLTFLLTPAQNS